VTIEVRTSEELKVAMDQGAAEIVVLDGSLAQQLKAVKEGLNNSPVLGDNSAPRLGR